MNCSEQKGQRLLSPGRQIRRVGVISPYTGGNLGNAAIISAMVQNIRRRITGAEVVAMTLNPDDTRRRHGIQAFPITAVSRSNYSPYNSYRFDPRRGQARKYSRLKRWLTHVPLLRRFWRFTRVCIMELAHAAAAAGVVRKLDAVVVTGGGALDEFWGGPWGHPWTLFKWGVVSRVCGVPFLFVSVGKCSLEQPLTRFFVRTALRLAEYRSYRDTESQAAVQTLIGKLNDPVYPDLAFSYPCPAVRTPHGEASPDGRLLVGVSPLAYCDPRIWPLKDERRYNTYLEKLAEMVKWLLEQQHRILLFTTDSCDTATAHDLLARISSGPADADAIRTLPSSAEQSVDSFLNNVAGVDLTIASRLHGVILCHLNATPVLAISFDPKVDAHMHATHQKGYCLDIDHFKVEDLIERFNALKSARHTERECLRSTARHFREELDLQYDLLLGAGHSSPMTGEYQHPIEKVRRRDVDTVEAR